MAPKLTGTVIFYFIFTKIALYILLPTLPVWIVKIYATLSNKNSICYRPSHCHRPEPLAVSRHLLPAVVAVRVGQEVHGRLRNAGKRAPGLDSRTSS
jgi:hypothetical protein